jgi:hypothetical protein
VTTGIVAPMDGDRLEGDGMDARWAASAAAAVVRHPSLWRTGVRQALLLAQPGWWRRRPFLPLPAPDYLRFRLETAYGGAGDRAPGPDDVVTYLRWCRDLP